MNNTNSINKFNGNNKCCICGNGEFHAVSFGKLFVCDYCMEKHKRELELERRAMGEQPLILEVARSPTRPSNISVGKKENERGFNRGIGK